jgi:hypothetical protein
VTYLSNFVDTLENAPILKENLDELQQTVHLMQTENSDEFFDVSIRNKKFGRVDAMNGPRILEKYVMSRVVIRSKFADFSLIDLPTLCKVPQGRLIGLPTFSPDSESNKQYLYKDMKHEDKVPLSTQCIPGF